MSALKTIRTHMLQSHGDVLIELPEQGLVVFHGDNSHGKSVIRKVLEDVIAYNISSPRVRKSLINMHESEGYMEITKYDGTRLFINLNWEAALTYVTYTYPDGREVKRYLADKTIPDLVRAFGFHYNKERDISLNIYDSDAALLFFRTNHVTNGDILNSALSDTVAQDKIKILQDRYNESLAMRQMYTDNARVATAARSEIKLYDIGEEARIRDRAKQLLNVLQHIYIPDIKNPDPIPMVTYVSLPQIRISTYKIPPVINLHMIDVKKIDKIWEDIKIIDKGVCPVCQRPFSSHPTYTSEM